MAQTFKGDRDVILAPWSETTIGWQCFMKTGCNNEATYPPQKTYYQTASMQQAVNTMRAAGYKGVISIPCIGYGDGCGKVNGSFYDGSSWLRSRPTDSDHQLIAEAHVYGGNGCDTDTCFDSSMAPITKVVPLIFAEIGETYYGSCGSSYISRFLNWADRHGVGYETWVWDTWNLCGCLISNYNGTPYSAYGLWVHAHYLARPREA
jgi:hypothetical protein